jgi:hypothetical protein
MVLVSLIYTSVAPTPIDVEQILASSRRNNEREGISGVLWFRPGHFLQCLEGSRDAVNLTYRRILQDARHEAPLLLHYQSVRERDFADWSMGYLGETTASRPTILRYSKSACLEPRELDGESCRRMLVELRERIETI